MKHIIILLALTFLTSCVTHRGLVQKSAQNTWVSSDNFLELPEYENTGQLFSKPESAKCDSKECNEINLSDEIYYRAILLDEKNYSHYLLGVWSGGDCKNDRWIMHSNGIFSSFFPIDDTLYSWGGNFFFKNTVHIEDGQNIDGGKEWNEAHIYYVPKLDVVIYDAIRNFDGYNTDGSINYFNFDDADIFYFKRCSE